MLSSINYVNSLRPYTGITVGTDPSHVGACDPEIAESVGRIPLSADILAGGSLTAGLFSQVPHAAKLRYIAQLCALVYTGQIAGKAPPANDEQLVSAAVFPGVRSINIAGERVVVVPGTTSPAQEKAQLAGWLLPAAWPAGGVVNDLYSALALLIAPLLPADTKLIVGHSMGGGLALLLAFIGQAAGLPIVGAVGIAAPRILSDAAIAATAWPNWINVTNAFDPVPLVATDGFGGHNWRMPANQLQVDGVGQLRFLPVAPSTAAETAAIFAAVGDQYHSIGRYVDWLKVGAAPLHSDPYAEHADEIQIRTAVPVIGGTPIYSAFFEETLRGQRLPIVARVKLGLTNWIVCGDSNMFGGFDCPGPATANLPWILDLCSVYE